MSEQTEALARQFEATNSALVQAVESMSEAQWQIRCAGEGWPAGVTAHHLAAGHELINALLKARATGQPGPAITPELIDQGNAHHAKEYAGCTRAETAALLRQNGRAAAETVRGLSDEQLGRSFITAQGSEMTVQAMVDRVLIGHTKAHSDSIHAATGA